MKEIFGLLILIAIGYGVYNFFTETNYVIAVENRLSSGYDKAYGSPIFKTMDECRQYLATSSFKKKADEINQPIFCAEEGKYD